MFVLGRFLRDVKAVLDHPRWVLSRRPPPDSHLRKRARILEVARQYHCETFIETGTFYGQTTNVARRHFGRVLTVELYPPLYELNKAAFRRYPHVRVFHGESTARLPEMLAAADGRILFWLDGHYSGDGTARGSQVTPIISELQTIRGHHRTDHCILIDDARLFDGSGGYPTFEAARDALLAINPRYRVRVDGDCISALP